jgi:hypothetical protein
MVAAAEMQLAHFLSIKREVTHIMDQIMEKIESLKRVIHVNIWNEDHPAGVLTNKEESYLECIQIQSERLDNLLSEDEINWDDNLSSIRQKAQEIKFEVQALFSRQQKELEALMCKSFSAVSLEGMLEIQGLLPEFTYIRSLDQLISLC